MSTGAKFSYQVLVSETDGKWRNVAEQEPPADRGNERQNGRNMGTINWYARQDSNLRPLAPEAKDIAAITVENPRGQEVGQDAAWVAMMDLRRTLMRRRRWYYAPVRLWRALWAVAFFSAVLSAAPVSAATLTPCTGSFDGPGMSLCEILGVPGFVGGMAFAPFTSQPQPTGVGYSAHQGGQLFAVGAGWRYVDADGADFNTADHPHHFAVWPLTAFHVVLGVEDLPDAAADFDYNDHVVQWFIPEPEPFGVAPDPVPEPTVLALAGAAVLLSRYMRR
jgi:hypothetical protein